MNSTCLTRILVVLLCAITHCSCSGLSYAKMRRAGHLQPTADKGLVLIYWRKELLNDSSGGMDFKIYANDQMLSKNMRRGAFYSWLATPGQYFLSSRGRVTPGAMLSAFYASGYNSNPIRALIGSRKHNTSLTVKPMHTNFIEMAWPFPGHEQIMMEMKPEAGEQRIQRCRWIGSR